MLILLFVLNEALFALVVKGVYVRPGFPFNRYYDGHYDTIAKMSAIHIGVW